MHNIQVMFEHLCQLIGSTPLSKIAYKYKGEQRYIYVKHEHYNLTGSIKDRMALYILHSAYHTGLLKTNDTIVEATSGNTGIAFSAIGAALGHKVKIFMPNWMSNERINLIRSFGADIELITPEQGGFLGSIALSKAYADNHENCFLPSQFSNLHNCEAHYKTTGPELWHQLKHLGVVPDVFIAGVGTGGTIMGVGKFLREKNPHIKLCPLEPSNSPTLSTGVKVGRHRIEGISDEFIPELVCLDTLDEIIDVDDGDSIIMAQMIAKKLGMGVGISSGANFIGAVKIQNEMGTNTVVATVFSDDNKKYLSTGLFLNEPVKDDFLSAYITDLKLEAVVNVKDLDVRESVYCIFQDTNIK